MQINLFRFFTLAATLRGATLHLFLSHMCEYTFIYNIWVTVYVTACIYIRTGAKLNCNKSMLPLDASTGAGNEKRTQNDTNRKYERDIKQQQKLVRIKQ